MIERQNGAKTLICDDCDEPFGEFFPNGKFNDLLAAVKMAGWRVIPDGASGWKHQCPDCKPGGSNRVTAQRKLLGL